MPTHRRIAAAALALAFAFAFGGVVAGSADDGAAEQAGVTWS